MDILMKSYDLATFSLKQNLNCKLPGLGPTSPSILKGQLTRIRPNRKSNSHLLGPK